MVDFAPGRVADSYTPDRLVAGTYPIVTRNEVLVSGQNLLRGALLGRITASGKMTLSTSGASDGSQVPVAILVDDVNASGGDQVCGTYIAGEFNEAALTYGASHTAASVRATLRDANIYLVSVQPA